MSENIYARNWFVLVRSDESCRPLYSLETASRLASVHPDMLRHYCRIGLLGEARTRQDAELIFDDHALYELRHIEHLRRHHGVNLHALPLVCNLAREIERLHAELRFLRDR